MLVIAHRGANREALENSWSAYELAIAAGATRIELDLQLTADHEVVINHDDSLRKTTGQLALCSRLTRAELSKIRLLNGEPLPFLDEILERLLPKVELNLELKGNCTLLAKIVGAKVAKCRDAHNVIISAFELPPLLTLKEHFPQIKRACLWGSDSFTWPYIANYAPTVFMASAATNIFHPDVRLVDRNLMDQARNRDWLVYPWVPMAGANNAEEIDREGLWSFLKTIGVHGLCTNYPRQLALWLADAKQDENVVASTVSRHVKSLSTKKGLLHEQFSAPMDV